MIDSYSIIACMSVFTGGPADGKLVPGDQLFKINNVAVDDLSTEQAADIIRYVAGIQLAISGCSDVQFYLIFYLIFMWPKL